MLCGDNRLIMPARKHIARTAVLLAALYCPFLPRVLAQRGGGRGGGSPFPSGPPAGFPVQDPEPLPASTMKTETLLVPVRVVIRDRDGHAIPNLRKQDFKLYQDGKQQDVLAFEAIASAAAPVTITPPSSSGSPDSGTAAPIIVARPPQRYVALFFDDIHLKLDDMVWARLAADKFLSSLGESDRAAVLTASGLGQADFTSDRDKLHQVLKNLAPHRAFAQPTAGYHCPPMNYAEADAIENQASDQVLGIVTQDTLNCAFSGDPVMLSAAKEVAEQSARQMLVDADADVGVIFQRIEQILRRVSVLPGQRQIVLVSPGFQYPGREPEFGAIVDRAVKSNVVVNSLDARGMYVSGMDDASSSARPHSGAAQGILFGLQRSASMMDSNVMAELADGTGGLFFHNDNNFDAGFRELAGAPEVYYLLGFSPRDLKLNGKYHSLKVSLATKSDFSIEARHGFFAPSRLESPQQAAKREIDDALFSQEEEHALPIRPETFMNQAASGEWRLGVKTNVDVARLKFQRVSAVNHEELQVSAALFDLEGNYVAGLQKTVQMDLKDSTLSDLKKTGVYVELDFDVKPGTYLVRLVARDSNDAHLSAANLSVDIPK